MSEPFLMGIHFCVYGMAAGDVIVHHVAFLLSALNQADHRHTLTHRLLLAVQILALSRSPCLSETVDSFARSKVESMMSRS